MNGNFSNLPKWAQAHIEQQDRTIARLQADVTAAEVIATGEGVESPWSFNRGGMDSHPLPPDVREVVWESKERGIQLALSFRKDGPHIWMHEGRSLAVQPVSSNLVRIVARGYREDYLA